MASKLSHRFAALGGGAHLHFPGLEPAVSLWLSNVDGRPHLFHAKRCLLRNPHIDIIIISVTTHLPTSEGWKVELT